MTVKRPAGRTPGEAAERDEIKPSPTRSAFASQVFRLIVTPEPLFQAHADLRAAGAVRAGLVDEATSLRLAMRAEKRIRAAQTGLPLPGRDRPPVTAEPLEFRRPVRRGEAVPLDLFLQRRLEKAARREDERTQRRLLPLIRAARNEALARGRAP